MINKLFIIVLFLLCIVSCERRDPAVPSYKGSLTDTVYIPEINDTIVVSDTVVVIITPDDTVIFHPDTTVNSLPIKSGIFSVSPTKRIRFSPGNLQYSPTLNKWRFAEHQYDYTLQPFDPGVVNTYGWADLFPYGYDNTPEVDTIIPSLGSPKYYYSTNTQSIADTYHDWGVSCPILNAEGLPNQWRTLTSSL